MTPRRVLEPPDTTDRELVDHLAIDGAFDEADDSEPGPFDEQPVHPLEIGPEDTWGDR